VKSPREKIAQALLGDYRPKHVFVLWQSLAGYRYYQEGSTEIDREIQQLMKAVGGSEDLQEPTKSPIQGPDIYITFIDRNGESSPA
jgi:hypothetical protein